MLVNDIHSQLNPAEVAEIAPVRSVADVRAAVLAAAAARRPVCVAGGRHAMGGQQFCAGGTLIDTHGLDAVEELDATQGRLTVQAGIQWPVVRDALSDTDWAFSQKQTGADRLSLGGAVAANVHGRGLRLRPFVGDVVELTVVDAEGELHRCSREEDAELFSLVAGGYGLLGVVTSVTLRLTRRRVLERVVEVREADGLIDAFDARIADGFEYGDFQFSIDSASEDFLRRGVFSCYRAVADGTPIPRGQRALTREEWTRLLLLTHTDKAEAFRLYSEHYLRTDGQLYLSDAMQFGEYVDGYHARLDAALGSPHPGSEMITEVYVPRGRLEDFLADAAELLRDNGADVIYGTIRLIERDDETVLAWAREPWACIIFNLHVVHTDAELAHARRSFCGLIDLAGERGGSFFLTYHRWASSDQVRRCHPRFAEFLARKLEHDPAERFQSDWYRHYRDALA